MASTPLAALSPWAGLSFTVVRSLKNPQKLPIGVATMAHGLRIRLQLLKVTVEAWVRSPARELPYAKGGAIKKNKKGKIRNKNCILVGLVHHSNPWSRTGLGIECIFNL